MAVRVPAARTDTILGRYTRLGIPFQWRDPDGALIDLEMLGYTAQVWVTSAEGVTAGPRIAHVEGTQALYQMEPDDLAEASNKERDTVKIVCVAENTDNVLPPNKREIVVGDWSGADGFPS